MATMTIDLREGFDGDRVVIAVDGRTVFDKAGVRTRYQISLAERVTVQVGAGPHAVRVSLPDQGASDELDVDPAGTPYLGVTIEQGRPVLKPAAAEFRYR